MTDDRIPTHIWRQIVAWLASGGTGRIVLEVHDGQVKRGTIESLLMEKRQQQTKNVLRSSQQ